MIDVTNLVMSYSPILVVVISIVPLLVIALLLFMTVKSLDVKKLVIGLLVVGSCFSLYVSNKIDRVHQAYMATLQRTGVETSSKTFENIEQFTPKSSLSSDDLTSVQIKTEKIDAVYEDFYLYPTSYDRLKVAYVYKGQLLVEDTKNRYRIKDTTSYVNKNDVEIKSVTYKTYEGEDYPAFKLHVFTVNLTELEDEE